MTERKTVYFDAFGVRRTFVTDTDRPGWFGVFGEQNMDEIAAGVQRDKELHKPRSTNKLLARIPTVVWDDLVERGIAGDDDRFDAWLNSDEAKQHRIWEGTI